MAGQEMVAPAAEAPREQIIDLMEALKASLAKKTAAAAATAVEAAPEEAKPKRSRQAKAG
jgi:non-homologous end joining protein Ku